MPEYLAPGVYVEEVSFRAKSIEGVSTTTTGFVGPARYGPIDLEADIITGLVEYERTYGDRNPLSFHQGTEQPNFLWHAVRAFFEEGGKRLYIARVFRRRGADPKPYWRPSGKLSEDNPTQADAGLYDDGHARAWLTDPAGPAGDGILFRARFPGDYGNLRVVITVAFGQNMLSGQAGSLSAGALGDRDVVWVGDLSSPFMSPLGSPVGSPPIASNLYVARYVDKERTFAFTDGSDPTSTDLRLNPPTGSSAPQSRRNCTVRRQAGAAALSTDWGLWWTPDRR